MDYAGFDAEEESHLPRLFLLKIRRQQASDASTAQAFGGDSTILQTKYDAGIWTRWLNALMAEIETKSPIFSWTVGKRERADLKTQIQDLLAVAGSDNWDGEAALAVKEETVKAALDLADKLPDGIVDPDVAATPHGEIDFDWVAGRNAMLTLSMSSDGILAWAALFDDFTSRGSTRWTGELICPVECCLRHLAVLQK